MRTTTAYLISLLLHLLMFSAVFFHFSEKIVPSGSTAIIQARLALMPGFLSTVTEQKKQKKQIANTPLSIISSEKIGTRRLYEHTIRSTHASLSDKITIARTVQSGSLSALLILIHDLINEKQRYPLNAQLLHQGGDVSVQFRLTPKGHIEHTSVSHSSGYPSLDQAALRAIQAIDPITQASQFLNHPKILTVKIHFKMQ